MGKVYYNQTDSRWKNHPYPANAKGYENKTIGSSGCGPTCAAMVVSSSKETITPDKMGDISRQNGYRVAGGTSDGLYTYVAQRWGLEMKRLKSSYEAHQACKDGYFVVIACGPGLWTTGGHFILAVGAKDNDIEIYDPYLYSGKFNLKGRSGKVRLNGNSAWVNIDTFKANSNAQRFFAFKINSSTPAPKPSSDPTIKYVNTNSLALNVRMAPGGAIVGSLPKGTQVLVYEETDGWSRIGDCKWVSSSYLASAKPVTATTKYVNTSSANLNVRKTAGGTVIGSLKKGTEVKVTAEQNGWSKISSPTTGWVSSSYLSDSKPASSGTNRHTVGQTKKFKAATIIFSNSNLSGAQYYYKANTSVKILQNVSNTVDRIYVPATGRYGYVNINTYK